MADSDLVTPLARGEAHGKVILFGEHAVVHGQPAIAIPVPRKLVVELLPGEPNVEFSGDALCHLNVHDSLKVAVEKLCFAFNVEPLAVRASGDLPLGVGFGSSAAFSVAMVRALAAFTKKTLSNQELSDFALVGERIFHGTPSGLDHTTVISDLPVAFHKGRAPRFFERKSTLSLCVAYTPRIPGGTSRILGELRSRTEELQALYEEMGRIAQLGENALISGNDQELGELFNQAHGALRKLGVSTETLEKFVNQFKELGAYGAKLTGAGGGGAVVAICHASRLQQIVRSFKDAGVPVFGWSASFPA